MTDKTLPKDLAHIAAHVREWSEDTVHVRLDADGEICFCDNGELDFYPDGRGFSYRNPHPSFVPDGTTEKIIGKPRYRDEWQDAVNRVAPIVRDEPDEHVQTLDDKAAMDRITEKLRHERYSAKFLMDIIEIVQSTGRDVED